MTRNAFSSTATQQGPELHSQRNAIDAASQDDDLGTDESPFATTAECDAFEAYRRQITLLRATQDAGNDDDDNVEGNEARLGMSTHELPLSSTPQLNPMPKTMLRRRRVDSQQKHAAATRLATAAQYAMPTRSPSAKRGQADETYEVDMQNVTATAATATATKDEQQPPRDGLRRAQHANKPHDRRQALLSSEWRPGQEASWSGEGPATSPLMLISAFSSTSPLPCPSPVQSRAEMVVAAATAAHPQSVVIALDANAKACPASTTSAAGARHIISSTKELDKDKNNFSAGAGVADNNDQGHRRQVVADLPAVPAAAAAKRIARNRCYQGAAPSANVLGVGSDHFGTPSLALDDETVAGVASAADGSRASALIRRGVADLGSRGALHRGASGPSFQMTSITGTADAPEHAKTSSPFSIEPIAGRDTSKVISPPWTSALMASVRASWRAASRASGFVPIPSSSALFSSSALPKLMNDAPPSSDEVSSAEECSFGCARHGGVCLERRAMPPLFQRSRWSIRVPRRYSPPSPHLPDQRGQFGPTAKSAPMWLGYFLDAYRKVREAVILWPSWLPASIPQRALVFLQRMSVGRLFALAVSVLAFCICLIVMLDVGFEILQLVDTLLWPIRLPLRFGSWMALMVS